MNSIAFVSWYLRGCLSGSFASSDCGPIWQLGVIAAFLLAAILALVVLRLRAPSGEA
jgi:hypothetical protein